MRQQIMCARTLDSTSHALINKKQIEKSTGLLESCSSLTHRSSRGIIPMGSLSWRRRTSETDLGFESPGKCLTFLYLAGRQTDTHRGVFKVVQTAVCQDEPPPLPGFNSPAFNKQKQTLEETRAQRHDACRRLRFSSIIVSPIFRSQPSLSGLKNVSVRSFPSSSGILNGSLRMLAYSFWKDRRESKLIDQHSSSQITKLSQWKNPKVNIFTQKQSR